MGLLRGAVALSVVTGPTGRDDIHPCVQALLRKRNNVLASELTLVKIAAAVRANVSVAHEEFAIGQARAQVEWVDVRHSPRANDAVDTNHRLLTGDGVVTPSKNCDLATGFPAHLAARVVDHRLFQGNPGLGKPLSRQFQDFHKKNAS